METMHPVLNEKLSDDDSFFSFSQACFEADKG